LQRAVQVVGGCCVSMRDLTSPRNMRISDVSDNDARHDPSVNQA
jgi:hypothetical protein